MTNKEIKVNIIIDTPEEMRKAINPDELKNEYSQRLNERGMGSIGAVPVNKKEKSA